MDPVLQQRVIDKLIEQIAELKTENAELRGDELNLGANIVFVGCYTEPAGHIAGDELGKGVYTFKLHADGSLSQVGDAAPSRNPSMLCISPNRQWLYATNEVDDFAGKGTQTSSLQAFRISNGGELASLGAENTKGDANCSVMCTLDSKRVVCANYSGGSITLFNINDNGSLGDISDFHQFDGSSVNTARQEKVRRLEVLILTQIHHD
jgi:6-phosphogluconolactonase (cycloisomerase 2 family)